MKQKTIIALILAALVLLTAVQAYQLNGLKSEVEDGSVVGSSVSKQQPSSGGSSRAAELPSSIKDLPQMVGGC